MTAYNSVRMRVKPGREEEFLEMNRKMDPALVERMKKNGMRKAAMIKTGDRSYCFIGEWDSMDSIVKSRPDMIKDLQTDFRKAAIKGSLYRDDNRTCDPTQRTSRAGGQGRIR